MRRSTTTYKESDKTYYQKNRKKIIQKSKLWMQNNPDRLRHNQYMHKYGISLAEFNTMCEAQKHKCAICSSPESKKDKKHRILPLVVDHCHISGKIRGLLCDNCNKGLGFFKDSVGIFNAAIIYLNKGSSL